jgi:hypothetical protein
VDFYTIFNQFYKVLDNSQGEEESFSLRTLKLLKSSQKYPWSLPLGPDGGDKLAGGEVELGHANKRQGSSIGLTCDRLVAEDWPGEAPASGGGGAAAARPRETGRR